MQSQVGIAADLYHVRSLTGRQKVLEVTLVLSVWLLGQRNDTKTGRQEVSQFNLSGLTSYMGKRSGCWFFFFFFSFLMQTNKKCAWLPSGYSKCGHTKECGGKLWRRWRCRQSWLSLHKTQGCAGEKVIAIPGKRLRPQVCRAGEILCMWPSGSQWRRQSSLVSSPSCLWPFLSTCYAGCHWVPRSSSLNIFSLCSLALKRVLLL